MPSRRGRLPGFPGRLRRPGLAGALLACLLAGGPAGGPARAADDDVEEDGPARRAEGQRWLDDTPETGRFRKLTDPRATLTEEQQRQFEELNAIGYLGGVTSAEQSGVTVYDPDRALDGVNFYTSGHDARAYLIDMGGEILHEWRLRCDEVWPESENADRRGADWWRRAHLCDNGDVIAIFEGVGVIRIDMDSNLIWENENAAHHDLKLLDDGDLLVLTRTPRLIPEVHPTDLTLEDFLVRLGPAGEEKERHSVFRAMVSSPWAEHIASGWKRTGDVFHTNTLHRLDGSIADRVPAFREGAILTSLNSVGLLAVWDLEKDTFTWARKHEPGGQHDPEILPNGNLIYFDNFRNKQASVVTEFDPATGETVWEYRGTAEHPFHSATCGTQQRLVNGNTLITESDGGRAFEVTQGGEMVWEFYNPERAGEDDEYIATIGEMTRIPWETVDAWLP